MNNNHNENLAELAQILEWRSKILSVALALAENLDRRDLADELLGVSNLMAERERAIQ